jgi:hypothetical protein
LQDCMSILLVDWLQVITSSVGLVVPLGSLRKSMAQDSQGLQHPCGSCPARAKRRHAVACLHAYTCVCSLLAAAHA